MDRQRRRSPPNGTSRAAWAVRFGFLAVFSYFLVLVLVYERSDDAFREGLEKFTLIPSVIGATFLAGLFLWVLFRVLLDDRSPASKARWILWLAIGSFIAAYHYFETVIVPSWGDDDGTLPGRPG